MIPTWRKPIGILSILLYIILWVIIVASISPWIENLNILVQSLFYIFCGIIWIFPLKPALFWMEHGHLPNQKNDKLDHDKK